MFGFGLSKVHALAAAAAVVAHLSAAGPAAANDPVDVASRETPARAARTVEILGLSWHPGFCETRARAPECRDQSADEVHARQFSLHGLWKVRQTYCGVSDALKAQDRSRKWLDLPELGLDGDLRVELVRAMPGAASGLDRHEWVKHGTCTATNVREYYARSLKLLAAVNASAVRQLFEDNIGRTIGEAEVKAAFDRAFGPGAGEKVKMRCRKDGERRVITGLTIGLGRAEASDADLATLIAAARPTKFGCSEGVVDEAGLQ